MPPLTCQTSFYFRETPLSGEKWLHQPVFIFSKINTEWHTARRRCVEVNTVTAFRLKIYVGKSRNHPLVANSVDFFVVHLILLNRLVSTDTEFVLISTFCKSSKESKKEVSNLFIWVFLFSRSLCPHYLVGSSMLCGVIYVIAADCLNCLRCAMCFVIIHLSSFAGSLTKTTIPYVFAKYEISTEDILAWRIFLKFNLSMWHSHHWNAMNFCRPNSTIYAQ